MHAGDNTRVRLPPSRTLGELLRSPLDEPRAGDSNLPGRAAAVLILLYDVAEAPHLLLTKRSDDLVHHPGQVSFPGGGLDPTDPDLQAAALRETWEEVGVDPGGIDVVARMETEHTMVSGFVVTPFIGVATAPFVALPSDGEIARVMEVPLADVLKADQRLPERLSIATLRYPLAGEDVWGATARILHRFAHRVRAAMQASA